MNQEMWMSLKRKKNYYWKTLRFWYIFLKIFGNASFNYNIIIDIKYVMALIDTTCDGQYYIIKSCMS